MGICISSTKNYILPSQSTNFNLDSQLAHYFIVEMSISWLLMFIKTYKCYDKFVKFLLNTFFCIFVSLQLDCFKGGTWYQTLASRDFFKASIKFFVSPYLAMSWAWAFQHFIIYRSELEFFFNIQFIVRVVVKAQTKTQKVSRLRLFSDFWNSMRNNA